jgi:hypothetical protein
VGIGFIQACGGEGKPEAVLFNIWDSQDGVHLSAIAAAQVDCRLLQGSSILDRRNLNREGRLAGKALT